MNCANHPDRPHKAFCQNCGKPVCTDCARIVGQAVFCEPCLELRLAAANAATGVGGSQQPFGAGPTTAYASYQSVPGGGTAYTGTAAGTPYNDSGVTPPPGSPNPGIAFLLGLIPGVGAMYNGQYSKGVVHLIVFAVLVSLAGQNGIFGIFVSAWIFYQAFEAFHTARARRDGTTLPNPFGLNDIGERFGFGRSWPSAASPIVPAAPGVPVPPAATATPGDMPPPPPASTVPGGGFSAPYSYTPPQPNPRTVPDHSSAWTTPVDPYSSPFPTPAAMPQPSRFPVGAVVLIGLGVLFLLGSTHLFFLFPIHYLLPILLIGVGVYVFVRRMTAFGIGFADDGSAAYRLRLVRALQSSVWIVLVGVLFLLDDLHILSWGRSWPLFIILGGVMAFVQRGAYTAVVAQHAGYVGYTPVPPQAPDPVVPSEPGSTIVPRDREGS